MKIKHIWSVLCKESVVNQDDNLISIHGALEELNAILTPVDNKAKIPTKINIPINYEITSFWFKKDKNNLAKAEIEYSLISPDRERLLNVIQNIEIPINIKRFRSRMKIAGIPLTKEGDYSFQVKLKEEGEKIFRTVSEIPLEIKIKYEPLKN